MNNAYDDSSQADSTRTYTYYEKYIAIRLLPGEQRVGMAMAFERDVLTEPARINDILPGERDGN